MPVGLGLVQSRWMRVMSFFASVVLVGLAKPRLEDRPRMRRQIMLKRPDILDEQSFIWWIEAEVLGKIEGEGRCCLYSNNSEMPSIQTQRRIRKDWVILQAYANENRRPWHRS